MSTTKRSAIYGPETWLATGGTDWSHWDLWFCLAACLDHDGDLHALADAITAARRFSSGSDAERKLSHLDDLARRLRAVGLDPWALAARADDRPALRTKARTKVHKQGLYERDLTDAMRSTARERLYERALRGRWPRFPVSPQPAYDRLLRALGEPWLAKGATLRFADRIETRVARLHRVSDPVQLLASRRALVTFMYETVARCDDSYGVLSPLARDALLAYAGLSAADVGLDPYVWCEDLCELTVWDDYGIVFRHETAVFANVSGGLAEHAERFLLALADELRVNRLPAQADDALRSIAYLRSAQGRLTRFAAAAERLGSDHWHPIVTMGPGRARARPRRHCAGDLCGCRPARDATGVPSPALHRADRLGTGRIAAVTTLLPVVVRCTSRLITLLRAERTPVDAPLAADDWYANLVWVDGRKCLQLMQAGTSFPVFVADVRVPDLRPFGRFACDAIGGALADEQLPANALGTLDEASVVLARTASRQILGFMNDDARTAQHLAMLDGGLEHVNVDALNRQLRRTLHNRDGIYVTPLDLVHQQLAAQP